MNYNILNKKIIKYLFIVSLIIIHITINSKIVIAKENETIKVGVPENSDFLQKQDDRYTGYIYDYLREISIYTGWEYEFIQKDIENLLDDLSNGKIDILAGLNKDSNNIAIYDFPKYNFGYTYNTLSILNNDDNSNKFILDNMNIGYFEGDEEGKEEFIEFCKENDINNINLIQYSNKTNKEFLIDEIKSKRIDGFISEDIAKNSELKVIAKFGSDPYYFVSSKGNSEIIKGLNKGLYKIKESDPYFNQNLYNKYFESTNNILILNKEEEAYIENIKPIKAVYVDKYSPIQYYDERTKEPKGIFIEGINILSEKSGLKFDFIKAESYEEAYEMIKTNKADIIIGMINSYSIADKNDFILTKSYIKFNLLKIVNTKKENSLEDEVIALPRGYEELNIINKNNIIFYDDIEECLRAVNEGIANSTYINSYSSFKYIARGYYPNLNIKQSVDEIEIAMGISKNVDKKLIDILHKSIYSISYNDMESIIHKNILNTKQSITVKEFFFNNLTLCLGLIILVFSIIAVLVFIIIKMRFNKIKEDKKILFEKIQLDHLTGIYNREAFRRIVKKYIEEKDESIYYSFIIIDIDYFKQINDNFGHNEGDKVLIDFANVLKNTFESKDVISRLGGDEFIILVKDINEKNIKDVENKIKHLSMIMNKEVKYNDKSQQISLSIGAIITKEKMKFNKLYTISDELLYEVKRNGRNGYKIENK